MTLHYVILYNAVIEADVRTPFNRFPLNAIRRCDRYSLDQIYRVKKFVIII